MIDGPYALGLHTIILDAATTHDGFNDVHDAGLDSLLLHPPSLHEPHRDRNAHPPRMPSGSASFRRESDESARHLTGCLPRASMH